MQVKKVITGFVIQVFDTESKKFVSQDFVGEDVSYEDMNGDVVDEELFEVDGEEANLVPDMVQPSDEGNPLTDWQRECHAGRSHRDGQILVDAVEGLTEYYEELERRDVTFDIAKRVKVPDTGNDQDDYGNVRHQVEDIAIEWQKKLQDEEWQAKLQDEE